MPDSEPRAAEVIEAYRRRRDRTVPLLLGAAAVVLLVVGLFLVIVWLTEGGGPPLGGLFAPDTPTPTPSVTPVPATPTPSNTPTPSEPSATPTPEGPITYIVEVGDTLTSIAESFGVDLLVLMAANNITDPNAIVVGQQLIIPPAGSVLPTPTALPATLLPGTKIEYVVQPGDTLQTIASQFNSTAEAIAEENDIEDPNQIGVGQILIVPVNIATPTPTFTPGTPTATSPATATPTRTATP
jgi:LysM repeat protein